MFTNTWDFWVCELSHVVISYKCLSITMKGSAEVLTGILGVQLETQNCKKLGTLLLQSGFEMLATNWPVSCAATFWTAGFKRSQVACVRLAKLLVLFCFKYLDPHHAHLGSLSSLCHQVSLWFVHVYSVLLKCRPICCVSIQGLQPRPR